jgi:hypothetical protein
MCSLGRYLRTTWLGVSAMAESSAISAIAWPPERLKHHLIFLKIDEMTNKRCRSRAAVEAQFYIAVGLR